MDSFNSLVIQIAIVILIICLILIGWAMYNSVHGNDVQWPPVTSDCPDYWRFLEIEKDGKLEEYCENNLKLGNGSHPRCSKFLTSRLEGNRCRKLALANQCGISWDGITENDSLREYCHSPHDSENPSPVVCN